MVLVTKKFPHTEPRYFRRARRCQTALRSHLPKALAGSKIGGIMPKILTSFHDDKKSPMQKKTTAKY